MPLPQFQCKKYKNYEYSGSLCEELCANEQSFKSFKCPQTDMGTIMFTAEKNGDVYAVKVSPCAVNMNLLIVNIWWHSSWPVTSRTI